jgi:hypothetical protein
MRALFALAAVLAFPASALAAPDPTLASLLSAGSTALPLGITAGLWLTGAGTDEGLRFDIGMTTLGIGAILGPSVGQIYAQGGTDAWVSFVLRAITGGIMVTGVGIMARGDEQAHSAGTALAVLGGIPTGLLALYDIIGASSSAVAAAQRKGHGPAASALPPIAIGGFSLCASFSGSRCPR